MDEPGLTHALGKHCSLYSVILFHIPLVLITFSFSIYPADWLESRLMPSPEISQHTTARDFFFFFYFFSFKIPEPHFAKNNLQIHTIKCQRNLEGKALCFTLQGKSTRVGIASQNLPNAIGLIYSLSLWPEKASLRKRCKSKEFQPSISNTKSCLCIPLTWPQLWKKI